MTVELVRSAARDSDVLWAARVSTKGEQSLDDVGSDAGQSRGLINYLMRDRHGCYDSETEVLTSEGWKRWPDVRGTEQFATLSPDDVIQYQRAEHHVRRRIRGPMLRVSLTQVDLLVTPDHRMLARRRNQSHLERWDLVPARDLLTASHRIRMGGGRWETDGTRSAWQPGFMALLGFFIGDGHSAGTTPSFRLRKQREIDFLYENAAAANFSVEQRGDRYWLRADEDFRLFAKKCYAVDRSKIIPREVLQHSTRDLAELWRGLMNSDGSVSSTGKQTYSTTSYELAGQLQELALKLGRAAVVAEAPFADDPLHFGTKTRYRVTFYRPRNLLPRVGWTREARARQVQLVEYDGDIFCVTVPNGVLYVRRNGKPAWCGNTPFEHNSMTFYVQAPIFVFREFQRHRIASYNEESGRYRELNPVFYVPAPERRLVQQGKPGAYDFVEGTPEQHALTVKAIKRSAHEAYDAYRAMLDAGVAREVARTVLPVGTYSSMYVTMNARSLMNFLSLRTKHPESAFPSFPQREIEMVAERMEEEFARLMPITHAAFVANGRVAP
jgi:thymidylate synthase (FAD)